MSRRGGRYSRSNFKNYGNKISAYPYQQGSEGKSSQHDNRYEDSNRGGRSFDNVGGEYKYRGGGGRGRYRGGSRRRPGGRPYQRGRYAPGGRGRGRSQQPSDEDGDIDMEGPRVIRPRPGPYERYPVKSFPQKYEPKNNYKPEVFKWNLITIIDGARLDRDWVISAIQQTALVQVNPVQYQIDGEDNASFCIEDETVANTIRNTCNKQLKAPDGNKLTILKCKCSPPITPEGLLVIKKVLSDRYNTETLHLDVSGLNMFDALKKEGIFLKLWHSRDMNLIMNIISEHISSLTSLDLAHNRIDNLDSLKLLVPQTPCLKTLKLGRNLLKSAKELDKIQDWDLSELELDRNPLCGHYQAHSDYISAVRERFPNVMVLDAHQLKPPVKFDVERSTKLPPPIAYYIPDPVMDIIQQFVKQYFTLYDSNRDDLLPAYHPDCMLSLCVPPTRGPPLSVYFPHSRNLRGMKDSDAKISTLKSSQLTVCALLKKLPDTEHDLPGFNVDVPFVSPTLVKFIIRGVFRQKSNRPKEKNLLRAFTRSFLCLTDGARLSILNEQLFIRNPTRTEMKSAFIKPPVTPSPSPVPESTASPIVPATVNSSTVVSQPRMDMIASFIKDSSMNAHFSEQCLSENGWDYTKAGQAFLLLKEQGKIPPEAFVK